MVEETTAGTKEFAYSMLWAAGLYFFCGVFLMNIFHSYYFIGAILSVLVFCEFGFLIMTRYAARFTYSLKSGRLRVNRLIGKRNKEFEFDCKDISNMYYGFRPSSFPKRPYNMRKTVFSKKELLFIEYKDKKGEKKGIVIQPSEKLRKKIEKERNKAN